MASTFTPIKTSNSRIFLVDGRARGDHKPSYEYNLRATGLSQAYGDVTKIEAPDPYEYGKFREIGQTRGAVERATTTLEGRYALDVQSLLMDLSAKGCAVDVQIHVGACKDPSSFNEFSKAIILEDAILTNYSTDDLGALASGDDAAVNEKVDVSAKTMYEVGPMSFGVKAGTLVTNEIIKAVVIDAVSCGSCSTESDGCKKVFALTKGAGGSASTPADVVYSLDKGVTWYAYDVDSINPAATDPTGMCGLGSYIVVIANVTYNLHYALKTQFNGLTPPTWAANQTGFVSAGKPNAIYSVGSKAFIVGDAGYIYSCEDPTVGVTVLDAGTVTISKLNDVYAISGEMAVAVGNDGVVVYTNDGTTWNAATNPVGLGVHLNCVYVKSTLEWWIGASNGSVYYTLNGGTTWTIKPFTGSGAGSVYDIEAPTASVMYIAHQVTSPATRGRILRSFDGGYSWAVLPEGSGTLPLQDKVGTLAVCTYDPNFLVAGGLADNGSDGVLIVGSTA